MRWFEGLIGEVPGSYEGVLELSRGVRQFQSHITGSHNDIKVLSQRAPTWVGVSRNAFNGSVERIWKEFAVLEEGGEEAAFALEVYAWEIEAAKRRVEDLRAELASLDSEFSATPITQKTVKFFELRPHLLGILDEYKERVSRLRRRAEECAARLRQCLHVEQIVLNKQNINVGELRKLSPDDILRALDEIDHVDYRKIQQNKIGDCYYVASLIAVANSQEGREWIKKLHQASFG